MRGAAQIYQPPAWATGYIGLEDALFLYDMARCVDPERIVEIGTASGVSSAVLLKALADTGRGLCDADGTPRLHSYDIASRCYFDPWRPVGSAVNDMTPELAGGLVIHAGGGAAAAAADHPGHLIRFAFLDANHTHPWPIADMLALQPCLAPGAWVVIHDINLAQLAREYEARTGQKVDWHHTGVQRLFESWPFEKVAGQFGASNIGAIRMPESGRITPDLFKAALDQPWESTLDDAYMKLLGCP